MSKLNEKAMANERGCGDFVMTFAEIGDVMGLKRGTVWTIYQRGLRKLRRSYPGILSELQQAARELDSHRESRYWESEGE